jgi:prevent-host-death family protein
MAVTASKLRENVYRILDHVLETGEPVEIVRGGRKLRIIPAEEPRTRKLERLAQRPETLLTDPEELVHLDWSKEWRP